MCVQALARRPVFQAGPFNAKETSPRYRLHASQGSGAPQLYFLLFSRETTGEEGREGKGRGGRPPVQDMSVGSGQRDDEGEKRREEQSRAENPRILDGANHSASKN